MLNRVRSQWQPRQPKMKMTQCELPLLVEYISTPGYTQTPRRQTSPQPATYRQDQLQSFSLQVLVFTSLQNIRLSRQSLRLPLPFEESHRQNHTLTSKCPTSHQPVTSLQDLQHNSAHSKCSKKTSRRTMCPCTMSQSSAALFRPAHPRRHAIQPRRPAVSPELRSEPKTSKMTQRNTPSPLSPPSGLLPSTMPPAEASTKSSSPPQTWLESFPTKVL